MSLHHGDLFDVLPTLAEASIDVCVTDPPYGLGFMGKEWDTFKPGATDHQIESNRHIDSDNPNLKNRKQTPSKSTSSIEYDRSLTGQRAFQDWCERWAREVFRVLKPGAHLLVCGAPRSSHRMVCGLEDAGFEIRDCLAWIFGQGFPKSLNLPGGLGTALKPAHEPIVLARKPCVGSTTANVQRYGTGALNIDACRIGLMTAEEVARSGRSTGGYNGGLGPVSWKDDHEPQGRWPANVVLDVDAAAMLDEQSGNLTSGQWPVARGEGGYAGGFTGQTDLASRAGSAGGASRFFYTAKPGRGERDLGCHDMDGKPRDDSRKEGNPGGDNPRNRGLQKRGNHHPTVKPVELMRWLVRLVTPIGGTVLDPFMGSGTTGMACAYEQRLFIGIEREAEYIKIARRRIAACVPLLTVGA